MDSYLNSLNSWLDLILKLNWHILLTVFSVAVAIIFLTIIPFGFGVLEYFLFDIKKSPTPPQGKPGDPPLVKN